MKAPLPEREAERLRALAAYELLDTQGEGSYDDITALASYICECPIALVVLLDKDRQWFKSKVGLEVSETPREQAFCAHAILGPNKTLIVPNAELDERFADNPLVRGDPRIRFYAGVPLNNPEGHSLGTLCVIDAKPRILTAGQSRALETLARQVVGLFELRRTSLTLARALENVKTLEGLLPICANCKSIRDEQQNWHSLEEYLDTRTDVSMTHGICPTCFEKLYPGMKLPD